MTSTPPPTPSGLLLIDKPVGPTSMAICADIRRRLVRGGAPKKIRVGHGGTLDPYASGLLVILVGRATRLVSSIMAGEKVYLADIDLGHRSPTDDMESAPEPVTPREIPDRPALLAACAAFVGRIMQAPPAHSAMRVGGTRAYHLARSGRLEHLEPRPVEILDIALLLYRWPRVVLSIRCGKGVYIRSLARDLGLALGTGGMLGGLRRTHIAPLDVQAARSPRALPPALAQADLIDPAPLPLAPPTP